HHRGGVRSRHAHHTAAASRPPIVATAKLTSGAPPRDASHTKGESAWLNASLPQGKPPNGCLDRNASCAVHSAPVSNGQDQTQRSATRLHHAAAAPNNATNAAWDRASTSHGHQPIRASIAVQCSSGAKNPIPVTSPRA